LTHPVENILYPTDEIVHADSDAVFTAPGKVCRFTLIVTVIVIMPVMRKT